MLKFVLIFIFILVLSGAIFFLFWPKSSNHNSNPKNEVLSTVKNIQPIDTLSQTKDTLGQNTTSTIKDIKNNLYDQAQNALNTIFDKRESNEKMVDVKVVDEKSLNEHEEKLYIIDVSKDDNFKIQLPKNSKYHLKFQNVPPNHCLYIGDDRYAIDNNKILALQFQKSGTYYLKTSNCDRFEKNIGEITVE